MARSQRMQWDPEAVLPVVQECRFGLELPSGVTLNPAVTPTVRLEQQSDDDPETWVDRSAEVTLGTPAVVTDTVNGNMANAAVQWTTVRATPASGEPEAKKNYRWYVEATRSDGRAQVGKPRVDLVA